MSAPVFKLSKIARTAIHIAAAVLLNLGIVLSAVYILFHILDQYNPHKFIYSNLPWLPIAVPILLIAAVVLYDLLFLSDGFRKHFFQKKRMWLIILCDLILFSAISVTLYFRTCTNPITDMNAFEEYQRTPPPRIPGSTPTNGPSSATGSESPASSAAETGTPDPSEDTIIVVVTPSGTFEADPSGSPATPTGSDETPPIEASATPSAVPETPTPTPEEEIPGLLGNKYAEKFADPPVEHVYDRSNVLETLADGTEKSLIYSYCGRNAAVDVYYYRKGKLEYQIADIYVRDLDCFRTEYSFSYNPDIKTQHYASKINAIVATNGDNFNSGKIHDGIVTRNYSQLYPAGGKKQDKYSRDLCVIFYDGTMRVYDCVLDRIDYDEIADQYPWQAFYFGPKLLNDDGTARTKFNSTLSKPNPRTALGYYEPGHYSLIVVLGTREMIGYDGKKVGDGVSPGMTLAELSALCEQLGFTAAYNLDGGGSSSMVWNKTVFGHNDRTHSDILAVVDQ